jgi:uncharacterized OsmC-like protein
MKSSVPAQAIYDGGPNVAFCGRRGRGNLGMELKRSREMAGIAEAIEKLSATLSAEPLRARAKNMPATARLLDGLRCEVTGPYDQRLVTDMPPAMGGNASGPNPGWLLRGALASCTATVIAMRAAKLGIALSNLEVNVETESDLRGILGLDDKVTAGHGPVRIHVKVSAPAVPPDVLREVVEWADRHSPVNCTVRQAPECLLEIEVA